MKPNITIKDTLKIQILNNLRHSLKTCLTIINDLIPKNTKLDKDQTIFKTVMEKNTLMKANQKALANFAAIKSHARL